MIAFHSPEGSTLRQLSLSRSALTAIWLVAFDEGNDSWLVWSGEMLAELLAPAGVGAEAAALHYVQAVSAGDTRRAQQLWAVLRSFPAAARAGRIAEVARTLQAQLPI
jgi:hypothetical protein